jgi:phage tail-like protein
MPAQYPMPTFHFTVEWGGKRIGFSEVTGLTQENQAIEYRDGSFPEYSSIKMPGLRKFSNIVLKRGVVKADNDFFAWLSTVKLNTVERRGLVISLLDEQHRLEGHERLPGQGRRPPAQGRHQRGGHRDDRALA